MDSYKQDRNAINLQLSRALEEDWNETKCHYGSDRHAAYLDRTMCI